MPTRTGVPAPRGPAGPPQAGPPQAGPPQAGPPQERAGVDSARFGWLGDPDTILLVEDDAGDVLLVEELLADSGMRASRTAAR